MLITRDKWQFVYKRKFVEFRCPTVGCRQLIKVTMEEIDKNGNVVYNCEDALGRIQVQIQLEGWYKYGY